MEPRARSRGARQRRGAAAGGGARRDERDVVAAAEPRRARPAGMRAQERLAAAEEQWKERDRLGAATARRPGADAESRSVDAEHRSVDTEQRRIAALEDTLKGCLSEIAAMQEREQLLLRQFDAMGARVDSITSGAAAATAARAGDVVAALLDTAPTEAGGAVAGDHPPRPWTAHKAGNGLTYYYNEETHQSTWDRPYPEPEEAAAPSDSGPPPDRPRPSSREDVSEWAALEKKARVTFERKTVKETRAQFQKVTMRLKELEQSESDFERTLIDQVSELRGEFATLQQKISHKAKFMPFADELGRVQDEHAKFGADYAEFCEKYSSFTRRDAEHEAVKQKLESSLSQQRAHMEEFDERCAPLARLCAARSPGTDNVRAGQVLVDA